MLFLTAALSLLSAAALAHPHVPRVIGIKLTEGEATLSYFTVPFNAEQVKGRAAGFSWHAGFARFATARDLKCGEQTLPAGDYKLNFVKGEGDAWLCEFAPQRVAQGKQALARAKRDKDEARAKSIETELERLRKDGKGEIVVALTAPKLPDSEHLRFHAECDGYQARANNDSTPVSGVEFDLLADFGTLHGALKFCEVFAGDKKSEEKPAEEPKKGK